MVQTLCPVSAVQVRLHVDIDAVITVTDLPTFFELCRQREAPFAVGLDWIQLWLLGSKCTKPICTLDFTSWPTAIIIDVARICSTRCQHHACLLQRPTDTHTTSSFQQDTATATGRIQWPSAPFHPNGALLFVQFSLTSLNARPHRRRQKGTLTLRSFTRTTSQSQISRTQTPKRNERPLR